VLSCTVSEVRDQMSLWVAITALLQYLEFHDSFLLTTFGASSNTYNRSTQDVCGAQDGTMVIRFLDE